MDHQRFDEITRTLASPKSRRGFVGAVVATVAAALGAAKVAAAPPEGKGTKPDKTSGGGKPHGRCAAGFTNCRGTCVDLQGDLDHCGACATACPDATVCQGGTCQCPDAAQAYSGGVCTTIPTLSVSFVLDASAPTGDGFIVVSGAGLEAGSDVTLDLFFQDPNESPSTGFPMGTVDANGEFASSITFSCGRLTNIEVHGTAASGTPISDSAEAPC